MTKSKAFTIVLIIFVVSIMVRLPNLNRPISKHHEFMSALILINIESWRQAGGGNVFHYVPLLNFQNPGDKYPGKNIWTDNKGNQWYLSLGPGWYIIPYFFYQVFKLPADPVYLRIVNLLFNLFSVVLLFYFLDQLLPQQLLHKYKAIVVGCSLFMFTPGTLWYFGNGYAHTGIMMPFVLSFLILVFPMILSPKKITYHRLLFLSVSIVLLVYIDWIGIFLSVTSGTFALWKMGGEKKYFWLFCVISGSIAAGVFLIFLQFSSYGGYEAVLSYWKARFFIRSIANGSTSFLVMLVWLAIHLITNFLPLIISILIYFTWLKMKNKKMKISKNEILFLKLYGASLVLYNLVLLEWSYEHEFSMIPWVLLLIYIAARSIDEIVNKNAFNILVCSFLIFSLSQYYFINRPGSISRDGTPYISYKNFGDSLKQIPPDHKIFINIKQDPMIEYYAGRNINTLPDMDAAKKYMQHWGVTKGAWIEHDNFDFKKIIYLDR